MKEKHMTPSEKAKREKIVKGMKKGDGEEFEKRYPGRGKEVMYATATKRAMKEDAVAFYKEKLMECLISEEKEKDLGDIELPLPRRSEPRADTQTHRAGEDPKNVGLDVNKLQKTVPGFRQVSGGDIITDDDVLYFHSQYLEHSVKRNNQEEIARHSKILKGVGVSDENISKMIEKFKSENK